MPITTSDSLEYLGAFLAGGVVWEGIKFVFPEIKRYFAIRKSANNSFYSNLDPILKSAGELFGKIESLSKEDFSSFINPEKSNSLNPENNKKYIYYLFSQFWAQLEFLRLESQYTSLSKHSKGNQLLRFVETFESRKFRLLDRSLQRIIGESLIEKKDSRFRILSLKDFLEQIDDETTSLSKNIESLEIEFQKLTSPSEKYIFKQKVLLYGVIIAILIDQFDPNYKSVRKRKVYLNKLTTKSKKKIRDILFKDYLPFVDRKTAFY